MGRAPCCDKANVKKGPWSPEEDAKLKAYIEEHGTGGNWIALPQKIGLKRCGKSCRLRWLNYLRPNIKHGGFSEEEDQIICSLYISIGSRWSIIAAQLPGRTDNDIKNYWNTRLKKKLLGRRKEPSQSRRSLSLINQEPGSEPNMLNHESPSQTLSSTALERMQLHLQLQGLNPFSFYNNPALWPKYHPLVSSNRLLQGQDVDAVVATNQLHQVSDGQSSTIESSQQPWLPMMKPDGQNYAPLGATMQEEFKSSNFNSVAEGLQAELHELLYGKNGPLPVGQDGHQLNEVDCFQELDGAKEAVNWWATNGLDEKSSSSSWESASALQPDSVFQEYVLGYDL